MRRLRPERQSQYESTTYVSILERVAANTRRLRLSRGWTQEQAAEHCDAMAPRMLQTIEAAETNLTATTLARLADGLGVDPQDLLAATVMPPKAGPGRPREKPSGTSSAPESDTRSEKTSEKP